jgi:biofilm PGA synthesis N-glycosyltransferase PgaC
MGTLSQGNQTCYVVITPARDEAQHIAETITSVVYQTARPVEWVIVDDGSTDGTGEIIDRFAAQHSWITALHRPNRGVRENNIGAIEAFFDGYRALKLADWEFLVNLDGDLSLGTDYFERCFAEFRKDPELGIGGGLLYHLESGVVRTETCPLFHVRGATKIYRRACWDAIGGLRMGPGWDTIDEIKANMLGWRTRNFPNVKAQHLRPTGAADGAWRDAVKNGQAEYFSGYHPLFMLVKCLKRVIQRPYIIGAAGLFCGFASAYLKQSPKVEDRALIDYVRKQQVRRLLLQDSIWK